MKILRDQSGQAMILAALSMTVLLGFVALAIDVGVLLHDKRMAQTAADSAAIAGAEEIGYGDWRTVGRSAASQDGFTDSSLGGTATVSINNGPQYGPDKGNTSYVEAIVQQQEPTLFMSILKVYSVTVSARAEALAGVTQGCVFTLGTSGIDINLSSGATVDATNCPVFDDSNSSDALEATSGATLNAKSVGIVGGDSINSGGSVNPAPQTGIAAVSDPLGSVPAPAMPSPCTSNTYSAGHTYSLTQGCYNGLSVSSGATVNLAAGTYYINGSLNLSSGATINGTGGVTFYITNNGSVNISSGTTMDVVAPTSGTYNGILFFQDRGDSQTASFSSGATLDLTGILYFPDAQLNMSSGGSSHLTADFVVQSMVVSSGFSFTDYALLNAASAGSSVRLVE